MTGAQILVVSQKKQMSIKQGTTSILAPVRRRHTELEDAVFHTPFSRRSLVGVSSVMGIPKINH